MHKRHTRQHLPNENEDEEKSTEKTPFLIRSTTGAMIAVDVEELKKASRALNYSTANSLLNILLQIVGGQDICSLHDSFMDSQNGRIREPHEAAFQDGARFILGQLMFIKNFKPTKQ